MADTRRKCQSQLGACDPTSLAAARKDALEEERPPITVLQHKVDLNPVTAHHILHVHLLRWFRMKSFLARIAKHRCKHNV